MSEDHRAEVLRLAVGGWRLGDAVDELVVLVDGRRRVVLLLFAREPIALVEHHLALFRATTLPSRRGNSRDVGRRPTLADNAVRGLSVLVELPVARRVLIRRVEDGRLEEAVGHTVLQFSSSGEVASARRREALRAPTSW